MVRFLSSGLMPSLASLFASSAFSVDGQALPVIAVGPAVLDLRKLVYFFHALSISIYNVYVVGLIEWTDYHASCMSRLN